MLETPVLMRGQETPSAELRSMLMTLKAVNESVMSGTRKL